MTESASKPDNENMLPPGTVVDGYAIQKVIGSGGFSLIYLAEDIHDFAPVVVKQFLPERFTRRPVNKDGHAKKGAAGKKLEVGREHFYAEAKALAALKHPNIVNIRSFFCIDDSAFLVMDYAPGKNLAAYIKEKKGHLSETFLLKVFLPLLDALKTMHNHGLLHLDIKPANIHVCSGGLPLLLDFGAAHHVADDRRMLGPVVTPGFSPVEQYYSAGRVGTWSDIYAMGATIRACIEGRPSPPAVRRDAEDKMEPAASAFKKEYSHSLLEALDWCMAVDSHARPQTVDALLKILPTKPKRSWLNFGRRKPLEEILTES